MNTDISHLTLIERACACGCGKVFKCLPTSPQRLWMRWHNPEFMKKGLKYDEDFGQTSFSVRRKKKRMDKLTEHDRAWRNYLAQTRVVTKKRGAA